MYLSDKLSLTLTFPKCFIIRGHQPSAAAAKREAHEAACNNRTADGFKKDLGVFISALLRPLANAPAHQQWASVLPAQWLALLDKAEILKSQCPSTFVR